MTIRNDRHLRGCMVTFAPQGDVFQTVWSGAASAARDPRFQWQPIQVKELPSTVVEISVLSHLHLTDDPLSLVPGKHGIMIDHPRAQGCLLPQVATEFGWDREEVLARCCRDKAGLDPQAERDSSTKTSLFTAEVFAEAATTH